MSKILLIKWIKNKADKESIALWGDKIKIKCTRWIKCKQLKVIQILNDIDNSIDRNILIKSVNTLPTVKFSIIHHNKHILTYREETFKKLIKRYKANPF